MLGQAETARAALNSSKTPDLSKSFHLASNAMVIGMYETAKKKIEEKLEHLREFNAESPQLFSEIETLNRSISTGLEQSGKAWNASTGTFDQTKLTDMTWATGLNERFQTRQNEQKAEQLANQEVTTKFDEYGYVVGVYVDGKFDVELTTTLQEAIRTQNIDLLKVFGSGFIDQLANNNGKSFLNEWFGERKFGAEFDGKKSYAVGQFVADLFSLVQGGAEFVGGGIWAFGGSAAITFFSGGSGAVAVPAISAGGLAVSGHGAGVFTSAWNNLGNGYFYEDDDLDVEITTDSKLPTTYKPNTVIKKVDKNDNLISERIFDDKGRVVKDIHHTNHGNPKNHPEVPHEHIWDWTDPEKPKPLK